MCLSAAYHPRRGRSHHRHHAKRVWKNNVIARFGYPPVNIQELDDKYEIQLFAAGYSKEDFKVNLKDHLLVVSVDKFEKEDWNRGFLQYQPGNFERRFELNDKIDKESISAKYENGVLTLSLEKLEGMETLRKDIEIN
jgi:HSP20 family protein